MQLAKDVDGRYVRIDNDQTTLRVVSGGSGFRVALAIGYTATPMAFFGDFTTQPEAEAELDKLVNQVSDVYKP